MSGSEPGLPRPRRILLATDLEGGSDRALDRAAQLACQWQATLHVVHAMRPINADAWWPSTEQEDYLPEAEVERVERQIRNDLWQQPDDLVIHVAAGEPAAVIGKVAEREACDLLVTGMRTPSFASVPINTTTAQLLRRAPQSLLVVKARGYQPYRKVLVGTDYTREARLGLETAAAWFADADFALMHALDIPYRSLLMEAGRELQFTRMEHQAMTSFLDSAALAPGLRERIHTHVEFGHPETMLRDHGLANEVDLVVVGALTRGLAFHMVVGGNAVRIMQNMSGDVLMVRAPRS